MLVKKKDIILFYGVVYFLRNLKRELLYCLYPEFPFHSAFDPCSPFFLGLKNNLFFDLILLNSLFVFLISFLLEVTQMGILILAAKEPMKFFFPKYSPGEKEITALYLYFASPAVFITKAAE